MVKRTDRHQTLCCWIRVPLLRPHTTWPLVTCVVWHIQLSPAGQALQADLSIDRAIRAETQIRFILVRGQGSPGVFPKSKKHEDRCLPPESMSIMSLTVYVLYQHVYAPVSADSEQDAHVLMTPHGGFIHASSLMSTCASRLGRDFASSDPFSI